MFVAVHFTPCLQVGQLTILAVVIALKAPDGVHRLGGRGEVNRHHWSVFEMPALADHRALAGRRLSLLLGFGDCRRGSWFGQFVPLQRHRQPRSHRTSAPGQARWCDEIVVVDVSEEVQIARTMTRDDNPRSQVEAIVAAQLKRGDRLAQASRTLTNDGDLPHLYRQVDALHQELLAL